MIRSLAAVLTLVGAVMTAPQASAADGLVLRYALDETTGTVVHDSSGHGRDAVASGDATPLGAEGLALGGVDGHVKLPDNVLRGLESVTVSIQVRLAPDQSSPYFVWGLGNTGPTGVGDGYLFTTGNGYRTSIATGNWATEQTVSAGRDLARGVWKTLTYTLGGTTGVLYEDGVEVARGTVTTRPSAIGGGTTTANYLGRSVYAADHRLKGQIRDFRLYDHALTAAEVHEIGSISDDDRVLGDERLLDLHDKDGIRGNITLPATGPYGTTITWASNKPDTITPTGEVTRPAFGEKPVKVQLTATVRAGRETTRKKFKVTVLPLPEKQPYEGYLFGYFTGEGTATGEQVYFAASRGDDPLRFDELNAGQPVLTSTFGDKGVRDPFIVRSPEGDRFFLIATDLKIHGNGNWDAAQRTGSKYVEVWESTDLVHWSDQRHVLVSPDTAGNTWAPEAYYDESIGAYVVFWASKLYAANDPGHTGNTYNRMLYSTTRDFRTFTEPKVWVDPGYSVIDSTVIKHGDTFYRFTKDERNNTSSTPCSKFILAEKSTDLRSTDYDFVADCIGKATESSPGVRQGEGPTVFKSNTEDKWYLFIDEFGGRGYVPFETTDLASGQWTMSTSYALPSRPRHGTVLPVTRAELDRVRAAFP
ncbi:immunoglobulin-like domain-containing protein [Saccharothrix variisporea]|uniref:Glycosyl hydrolase family 43 n=1 Tax=Saccharothrix variisporea TaxID=543527 RepID=A0A495X3Z6_9PSEU|nr:immunoglobulin-like domain-containing protein [Saccharothrix variisporea]RKT67965.1 glycosyl hydrolase family 43 [Saccharothrix variisporea]